MVELRQGWQGGAGGHRAIACDVLGAGLCHRRPQTPQPQTVGREGRKEEWANTSDVLEQVCVTGALKHHRGQKGGGREERKEGRAITCDALEQVCFTGTLKHHRGGDGGRGAEVEQADVADGLAALL